MTLDTVSGNLFALDWLEKRLVEFDSAGRPIRFFGGDVGSGPGQVTNPFSYDLTRNAAYLLDEGSNKLLIYDRNGELREEYPLEHPYTEFAVGPGQRIYALPGSGPGLIDVLAIDGDSIRLNMTIGAPNLHDAQRCRVGCKLHVGADGKIVLLQGTLPRVLILDERGKLESGVALNRIPIVEGWIAEEAEIMAGHDLPAGASASKTFVWQISQAPDGAWVIPFLPPRTGTRPRQLWLVSPDFTIVRRFEFDRVSLGNSVVVSDDTIFALDVEDGGLYRTSISEDRAQPER